MTVKKLYNTILNRQKKLPNGSYVASLFIKGRDHIAKKLGEEAVEVVLEAKNKNRYRLISELADLWFHTLIFMALFKIKPEDINKELEKRRR